jgi:hypothetical protein
MTTEKDLETFLETWMNKYAAGVSRQLFAPGSESSLVAAVFDYKKLSHDLAEFLREAGNAVDRAT